MDFFGRDLKSKPLIIFKASLFVVTGVIAAGLLLASGPNLKTAFLLGVVIWAFCRAYYFVFYVIENYLDDDDPKTGLLQVFKAFTTCRAANARKQGRF